jgi:anti-anti-sigma regulatory factor
VASLRLRSSLHGTTATVVASGDLTPGTAPALEEAVTQHIDAGARAVIIDLRDVTPEPVAAAQALVAVATRAADEGVTLQLCAGDAVTRALETGKTLALFSAIDDAVAAAASLEGVLGESVDATGVNARDAEVTWITTDEPEAEVC